MEIIPAARRVSCHAVLQSSLFLLELLGMSSGAGLQVLVEELVCGADIFGVRTHSCCYRRCCPKKANTRCHASAAASLFSPNPVIRANGCKGARSAKLCPAWA